MSAADGGAPPRVYLIAAGAEIARRRTKAPPGRIVEAWPDARGDGFWVGAESKALLDGAGDAVLAAALSLPASSVAIYYGPQLCDLESLPTEESLRARVLSVHAVAVAWATLDRFGQRNQYEPQSPADPIFHLRRPGGTIGHLWRLFRTKTEAIVAMEELHGRDSEGVDWARALSVEDFDALLARDARVESG